MKYIKGGKDEDEREREREYIEANHRQERVVMMMMKGDERSSHEKGCTVVTGLKQ